MQYDSSVPAYLRDPSIIEGQEAFSGGIGGQRGPHVTVKNGRFLLIDTAGEPKPVQNFDNRGPFLDMVVVDANPGLAKTFYSKGYTEGESSPPDCWSNDGREPDASILEPIAHSCAQCPNNAFGSAITPGGKQSKACSDRKRLAALFVYDFSGPLYEFSVSPSNLKLWNEHVQNLTGRGIPLRGAVTRVYTDSTRQGGLLFEAAPNPAGAGIWFVPENLMGTVNAARLSDECKKAIGTTGQSARPLAMTTSYVAPQQITHQQPAQQAFVPTATAQAVTPSTQSFANNPGSGQAGAATFVSASDGSTDAESPTRRPRRTKAQMEAERREKASAASSASPSNAAPSAAFATAPSNGNQRQDGFAPAATQAFTPPQQTSTAFGGSAGIRMPEPDVQPGAFGGGGAAFGVVTNPTPASADVDAMLASVMGG